MLDPVVSVIIAAYNATNYIEESINSILGQTISDFELILIDDGSTDNTLAVIEKYAQIDARIVVVSQKNAGPASARNVGISMAKSQWIAILDADDIALPERLEQQLEFVTANPDTVLLGTGCIEIDENGGFLKTHRYPTNHGFLIRHLERQQAFPPHSSCLYHTETVRRLGGFNKNFIQSEDADLWLCLSEVGHIACLPQPMVKLRKHSAGISNHNQGKTQRVMGMAARACHFLRLKGLADPSQEDTEAWKRFVDWLVERLENEQYFERHSYWNNFKTEWRTDSDSPLITKIARLCGNILLSGYGRSVLYSRLFGSNLANRLANEWEKSVSLKSERPVRDE
jgi:glycosyltransferase involved in cell wall biosynthesis